MDCMMAWAISSSLTSPLVNSSTAEPRSNASSRRSPSMSGFVCVLGATSAVPSSTSAPDAFIRRARIAPPTSKTTTSEMLTAGGRMLNKPPESEPISTLASRSMEVTNTPSEETFSTSLDAPRSTSSSGISVTDTSTSSPMARFVISEGDIFTVQSVRSLSSPSRRTADKSALSTVFPSFRTTKVSARPSSRDTPWNKPSIALLAVMLAKVEGITPTETVSEASTNRPLLVAFTLMRISKAFEETSA